MSLEGHLYLAAGTCLGPKLTTTAPEAAAAAALVAAAVAL